MRPQIVRLSSKGQVVIPARIRNQLGLKKGQAMRISASPKHEVVLTLHEPSPGEIERLRDRLHASVERSRRDPETELYRRRQQERLRAKQGRRERRNP